MSTLRVGVIGLGYWGPNLVRNLAFSERADIVAAADARPERRELIGKRYPAVALHEDGMQLIERPDLDAVCIATPLSTHFELARAALSAGKHVLVEKPMCQSVAEADELIALAQAKQRVLLTDHTFVYTSAVRKIREAVDEGQLGRLLYFDSVRVNLGLFQRDANVLWDLAVHDLSILSYLRGGPPRQVTAVGARHVEGCPETMAYLTCTYDDGFLAHIHVNWYAPKKIRQILLGGTERMVVYDDVEAAEKVRVYDKGIVVEDAVAGPDIRIQYRTGDMYAPFLPNTEALGRLVDHFCACVLDGEKPLTGGEAGRDIVQILSAAERSLANGGTPVSLEEVVS